MCLILCLGLAVLITVVLLYILMSGYVTSSFAPFAQDYIDYSISVCGIMQMVVVVVVLHFCNN